MADRCGEVSLLLGELRLGRKDALERLIPLVYKELRRVAGRCELRDADDADRRDEKSLIRWRTQALHHEVQEKGRFEIFQDYRLRVGEVIADNQLPPGQIMRAQRFDETECDAAKLLTLTERVSDSLAPDVAAPGSPPGLVEWEVFESIYQRGKLALLASWREAAAVPAWAAPDGDARHRRIRVIRSYGMFERAEAPQYYPPLPRLQP